MSPKIGAMFVLFHFALFSFSCKKKEEEIENPSSTASEDIEEQLSALAESIEGWVEYCGPEDNTVSKENCDMGDAALFGGLACASGDDTACEGVAASQGSDGRWWRNPEDIDTCTENCFSRDMSLGVMLYLVTTEDTEAAEDWMSWITSNSNKLCDDDTSGQCTISSTIWGTLGEVWEHLDLTKNSNMEAGDILDSVTLLAQAKTTEAGYQLHLVGVNLYLRQVMDRNTTVIADAAAKLAERQDDNPFFAYLNEGASDDVGQMILDLCPEDEPSDRTQWAWERDTDEEAWDDSMGHDCLFMTRLYN